MEYITVQVWIICLMAFAFGPFMPIMFIYGALGMLIHYITIRLRIAYSVKRIPKYKKPNFDWTLAYVPVLFFTLIA